MTLFQRWFIRVFFLFLLLLCLGGWMGSYVYCVRIVSPGRQLAHCTMIRGRLYFSYYPKGIYVTTPYLPGRFAIAPVPDMHMHIEVGRNIMGFTWGTSLFLLRYVGIPFWFPTTLTAGALFCVWRKTRRMERGGAFPVEIRGGKR